MIIKIKMHLNREVECQAFIEIEALIIFLIILFTIFKKGSMVSVLFLCTFMCVFASMALILSSMYVRRDLFLLWCGIVLFSICAVIRWGEPFGYYKKLIMFLCTVTYFYVITVLPITTKIINTYFVLAVSMAIIFVTSFKAGVRTTYAGGITLNFTNPNFAGMWLLHTCLYLFLLLDNVKRKYIKFFILFLIGTNGYLLWLTRARSCIIALFVFLLFRLLPTNKIPYRKWYSYILGTCPLWCAILYMKVMDSNIMNLFSFMVSTGKTLTSRKHIWSRSFMAINEHIWLGDYYGISDGTGSSQLHNTHIDIWASYGVITEILFIFFLIYIINYSWKSVKTKQQQMAIIAFGSIIVMGIFEATLVSGGLGIYFLSGGFLAISRYQKE